MQCGGERLGVCWGSRVQCDGEGARRVLGVKGIVWWGEARSVLGVRVQ